MKAKLVIKGGKGSGNFGHVGRPGQVGGSAGTKDYPGFDTTDTGMPWYNNMLKNKDYFERAKGVKFKIVEMNPIEYLQKVAEQQNTSYTRQTNMIDNALAVSYARLMKSGTKFPMPFIDYSQHSGQEGRHRAYAASLAHIRTMPVMIIEDVK